MLIGLILLWFCFSVRWSTRGHQPLEEFETFYRRPKEKRLITKIIENICSFVWRIQK